MYNANYYMYVLVKIWYDLKFCGGHTQDVGGFFYDIVTAFYSCYNTFFVFSFWLLGKPFTQ